MTTTKTVARGKTKESSGTMPASTKKPAPKPKATKPKSAVPAEQRANYVEVAAYYIAERRGFAPGDPLADWIEAEAEIDRLLASGHFGKD